MKWVKYLLSPNFFDDDCLRFYQRHFWIWCLRMRRMRCLFGKHKWIIVDERIGSYCDNCPMEKDGDGTTHLADIGKT